MKESDGVPSALSRPTLYPSLNPRKLFGQMGQTIYEQLLCDWLQFIWEKTIYPEKLPDSMKAICRIVMKAT